MPPKDQTGGVQRVRPKPATMVDITNPGYIVLVALGPRTTHYELEPALRRARLYDIQPMALMRQAAREGYVYSEGGFLEWRPEYLHQASLKLANHPLIPLAADFERSSRIKDPNNLARWAFYRNEPGLYDPSRVDPISVFLNLPELDDEWLGRLHSFLQQQATGYYGFRWLTQAQLTPLRTRLLQNHPELASDLSLLQGNPPESIKAYQPVLQFLRGESQLAHQTWQKQIARRKSGPVLPGLQALFGQLAALRQMDLQAVIDSRYECARLPRLSQFITALALHLLDLDDERSQFPILKEGIGAALHASLEALLPDFIPRFSPDERAQYRQQWSGQGLQALVTQLDPPRGPEHWGWGLSVRQPWENWLESLRSRGERPISASKAKDSSWRLSWHLDAGELTPVKQKEGRNGWSNSSIAWTTLLNKPPDFLSEQDRVVLGKVRRLGQHHQLTADAWTALLGHPHLFLQNEPARLEEFGLRLAVEQTPLGLVLTTQPPWQSGQDHALVLLGPGRIGLCRPTPEQQGLLESLEGAIPIPEEAAPQLLESLKPWMERVELHLPQGLLPEAIGQSAVVCRIHPFQEGLRFQLGVLPAGPEGPFLNAASGPAQVPFRDAVIRRDLAAEQASLSQVCPSLLAETHTECADPSEALETLLRLQQAGLELHWPAGKAWNLRPLDQPLRIQADGDGEWFEVRGSVTLDDGLRLEVQRLLELARASQGRFLQLSEGRFLALTHELKQRLSALDELVEVQRKKLRLNRLAVGALAELGVEGDAKFRQSLQAFQEAENYQARLPGALQAELRDYQLDGFRWLARRVKAGAGCCLADDMGLGKTLQVLALLLKENGPHLVVCPTSVLSNWRNQARSFAPTLEIVLLEGKGREALARALKPGQVGLCSYRILLQDAFLSEISWGGVVLDEAQFIKNPDSKTAKAAGSLQARFRVATTGTPIENRLVELWSLFNFLNPGLLGSLSSFQKRFENVAGARPRLRRLTAPFLLRRLKSQVLDELPPRTDINLDVELSPQERAIYENLREQALHSSDPLQLLAQLTRLRQACCHPQLVGVPGPSSKFAAFMELGEELRAGRHRVLVFSQFVELLQLLRSRLQEAGWSHLYLDGSTPSAQRPALVAEFQKGETDFFLISLKAGGTGLNLTAADYVVHLDPWWNPAAEDQASDRAHRIGQTRPVTVYRLVAQDTLEERVLNLHAHKRELAQSVLEGRENEARLNAAELLALLQA